MPEQKSTEQLQKEREEAAKQLEQILNTSRPKGLVQGTATGCSNMLKGAVGGAGFAVLGPTLGLTVGLQRGGLLGGIVGVTAGAIAGIIGGAAMVVGGALGGAGQVIRGLVAAPESMVAPSQGKWWNEYEGKWKLTNLEEDKGVIENVPEDDSDILGKVQEEVDASIKGSQTGTVVDMYYYDVLEVPSTVEPSALKRKYYLLARQNHPDKAGPDNKEAAAKFQAISEAYQVLSDPKLREQYDKVGKQGLSADKTSTNSSPQVDSAILFAFLFGSDQFYDYIGRLSTATSASIGDSPKISLSEARTIQERRVIRLALKLATKIDAWVELAKATQNAESSGVGEQWRAEVLELRMASFGHQLVTTIGKVRRRSNSRFNRCCCRSSLYHSLTLKHTLLKIEPFRFTACWPSCTSVPLKVDKGFLASASGRPARTPPWRRVKPPIRTK